MEDDNNISMQDLYDAIGRISGYVKAIKGWVSFMGIILLITLLLSLFGGCTALLT